MPHFLSPHECRDFAFTQPDPKEIDWFGLYQGVVQAQEQGRRAHVWAALGYLVALAAGVLAGWLL